MFLLSHHLPRLPIARPLFRSFATSLPRTMQIVPVPVRDDNYAYLLIDEGSKTAAAVDPYDVPKVAQAAESHGVSLVAVLTTHHHFDHSGGNQKFASTYPGVPVYGGSNQIPALTTLVKDKDEFIVGHGIHVKCLATPCHTQDSICYHVTSTAKDDTHPGGVFTGDTLFIGGTGRFFEGTGAEMHAALAYLLTLPPSTIVYNGHEYTAGNVAFARSVDPSNADVQRLDALAKREKIMTGKTTLADERGWNVFMRLEDDVVRKATNAAADATPSAVMDALREMKNSFRG